MLEVDFVVGKVHRERPITPLFDRVLELIEQFDFKFGIEIQPHFEEGTIVGQVGLVLL